MDHRIAPRRRPRHVFAGLLLATLSVVALVQPALAQPDLSRRIGTTVADTGAPGYRFESFRLASADGQRRYRVHVAIPLGTAPANGFPSAFLLDGNAALMEVDAELLATLADAPRPPVVAFVGHDDDLRINAPARTYDYTPRRPGGDSAQVDAHNGRRTGGADAFLDLLADEVLPRVAALAPLDPQRQALWGHSYGGLFTLHVLFNRPQAFDRYVAVDPSLWWGDGYLLEEERRAELRANTRVGIFVGAGAKPEARPAPSTDPAREQRMQAIRRARASVPADATLRMSRRLRAAGLAVDYRTLPGLSHGETLGASLPLVLRGIAGLDTAGADATMPP